MFNDDTKELLLELQDYANKKYFEIFARVSYPGNHFNRGNCIFAIDSTAGATWLGTGATSSDAASGADKSKPDFETVVRPVPQVDVNNPQMISQGPSICLFNKQDPQEVVASWIFAQFMLTDEVQMGYVKTEGYLPVTSRTNESEEFKAYLNNENEYKVKRDATKLVLDNIENTFISPVFNGSSDVRDAGSYLIEGVCGNNTRYKKYNELEVLYEKCIKNYGLQDLLDGKLPSKSISKESIIMLSILGITWILLGTYVVYDKIIKKKRK